MEITLRTFVQDRCPAVRRLAARLVEYLHSGRLRLKIDGSQGTPWRDFFNDETSCHEIGAHIIRENTCRHLPANTGP